MYTSHEWYVVTMWLVGNHTHFRAIHLVQFYLLLIQLFPNCTQVCVISYANPVRYKAWLLSKDDYFDNNSKKGCAMVAIWEWLSRKLWLLNGKTWRSKFTTYMSICASRVYLQRLIIFIPPETSIGVSLFIVKQIKLPGVLIAELDRVHYCY